MTIRFDYRGREVAVTIPEGAQNVVIEVPPTEASSENKKPLIVLATR
jgi:hypothetical protein